MGKLVLIKGMINGMEILGAEHHKTTKNSVLFKIPKESAINDEKKLKRAKKAFSSVGLTLKIKILCL